MFINRIKHILHEPFYLWLALCVLIVFVLRVVVAFCIDSPFIYPDTHTYVDPAVNVMNGHGFSIYNGYVFLPVLYRTPGYPLFLASVFYIFGKYNYFAVVLVQIFISILKLFYVYKIVSLLSSKRKVAIAVLFLMIIDLDEWKYSYAILSETLFSFLLVLSVYNLCLFFKYLSLKDFIISMLLLMCSSFVRPIALYYFISVCIMCLIFYLYKVRVTLTIKKTAKILILLLLIFLPILFWSYRNHLASGRFCFSNTDDVFNVYIYPKVYNLSLTRNIYSSLIYPADWSDEKYTSADCYKARSMNDFKHLYNQYSLETNERKKELFKRFPFEVIKLYGCAFANYMTIPFHYIMKPFHYMKHYYSNKFMTSKKIDNYNFRLLSRFFFLYYLLVLMLHLVLKLSYIIQMKKIKYTPVLIFFMLSYLFFRIISITPLVDVGTYIRYIFVENFLFYILLSLIFINRNAITYKN